MNPENIINSAIKEAKKFLKEENASREMAENLAGRHGVGSGAALYPDVEWELRRDALTRGILRCVVNLNRDPTRGLQQAVREHQAITAAAGALLR